MYNWDWHYQRTEIMKDDIKGKWQIGNKFKDEYYHNASCHSFDMVFIRTKRTSTLWLYFTVWSYVKLTSLYPSNRMHYILQDNSNNNKKNCLWQSWSVTYQTVRVFARRISSASSPVKSRTALTASFSKLVPKLSLQQSAKHFTKPNNSDHNYYY